MTDTIFALSTAPGRAGIAVIRLSGPGTGGAVESLTGRSVPPPRRATLRRFLAPDGSGPIDRGLVLWLPGPTSFSGEDMAEFHVHGGHAVPAAMLRTLGAMPGLRLAEPGEFSRRAFENGRLDLTEVEGIADLITAETEAQRRQALRQLSGELGRIYEDWRGRLLRVLAHMEAAIDFPEEDLPADVVGRAGAEIGGILAEMRAHLEDGRRGERLREGLSVAIIGPPNAGKSSLLNWLVRREAAIVSATAGTTRDVIEVHLDIGGYPVLLADTAGLREAAEAVEQEGVRRALRRAETADLRIVLFDATAEGPGPALEGIGGADSLLLVNKCDLRCAPAWAPEGALPISIKTGQGLDRLLRTLEEEVGKRMALTSSPALTRERHRQALERCAEALGRAGAGLDNGALPELVAEDLRLAVRSLGRITGKTEVEDMLDVIFAEFCIGK